jgi:hypothetical protein
MNILFTLERNYHFGEKLSLWREIINWLLLLIFPFNSFGFHGYTQVKINQDGFNTTGILILLLIINISIYSGIVLVKHQNL